MKKFRSVTWVALLGAIVLYIYLKHNALQANRQNLKGLSEGTEDEVHRSKVKPHKRIPIRSVEQAKRAAILRGACEKFGHKPRRPKHIKAEMLEAIYVVDSHELLYCGIAHAGDTNWKKIALVLSGHAASAAAVSSAEADAHRGLKRLSAHSPTDALNRLYNYTSVVFVRDPMERVVSAFLGTLAKRVSPDKEPAGDTVLGPSGEDDKREIVARADTGITFQQFVELVLSTSGQAKSDWNWRPYYKACNPCLIRYNFIGKLETSESDAAELLSLINAPKGLTYPATATAHSSENITRHYLAQLPLAMQQALYNTYYKDYLLFGYPPPAGIVEA